MNEKLHKALTTAPRDRQTLALWVENFFGFKPQSICRCQPAKDDPEAQPHTSQLDYLESAFFNQHSSCVYMACRNGGKSQTAAIAILLDCWFKPGIKIAVAGFIKEHSLYIQRYMQKPLLHFEKIIGRGIIETEKKEKHIRFENGSEIYFFSGGKSEAEVSGCRPNVLFCDEADKFPQAKFDGISNALEGGGDIPSRFDILSTNYTLDGDGVILKQIERYEQHNRTRKPHMLPKKVFKTCLLDILANCDDRYDCETCPLWRYCKGQAKLISNDGYYKIEEAIGKTVDNSRPSFEAQYLLLRPSSEYSYFPEFCLGDHILDPDRPLNPLLHTFISFDFGAGRCPHAATIIQKDGDGNYVIIDEFEQSANLETFCQIIKNQYPNILDADCFYDPAGNRKEHMRESKSYAMVLRSEGFFPRCKQLKRRQTFELLRALISPASGKPKFFVNSKCKKLIRQIQAAEHEVKLGRISAEPADGRGDDLLDTVRYTIGWTFGTYAKHSGRSHIRFF